MGNLQLPLLCVSKDLDISQNENPTQKLSSQFFSHKNGS